MSEDLRQAHEKLKAFALSLPGAYEDHPWGESVVKVNKKIFVFFGLPEHLDKRLYLGVKLPETSPYAVMMSFAKAAGYGLGKHGWISAELTPDDSVPLDMLLEWVEESYRAVAPKRLVAELDVQHASVT
jgi:predicted DNA-binding protein (MmcQ/YjbR family)